MPISFAELAKEYEPLAQEILGKDWNLHVGIYTDAIVATKPGYAFPLLNRQEIEDNLHKVRGFINNKLNKIFQYVNNCSEDVLDERLKEEKLMIPYEQFLENQVWYGGPLVANFTPEQQQFWKNCLPERIVINSAPTGMMDSYITKQSGQDAYTQRQWAQPHIQSQTKPTPDSTPVVDSWNKELYDVFRQGNGHNAEWDKILPGRLG